MQFPLGYLKEMQGLVVISWNDLSVFDRKGSDHGKEHGGAEEHGPKQNKPLIVTTTTMTKTIKIETGEEKLPFRWRIPQHAQQPP